MNKYNFAYDKIVNYHHKIEAIAPTEIRAILFDLNNLSILFLIAFQYSLQLTLKPVQLVPQ